MRLALVVISILTVCAGSTAPAAAQSPLDVTVAESTQVLREIMAVPLKCIPHSLLHKAQAIAIIPGMKKAGLIIGVEHGKGVLVTRDDSGTWQAPVFITISGGSIGLQVGVQSTDLVLVFVTKSGVDRTLQGRVNIGTDLAVAAGPIGRDSLIASDGPLKSDIFAYSRSSGLFAGFAINGATIHTDFQAQSTYYAQRPGHPLPTMPASAVVLAQALTSYDPQPAVVPVAVAPAKVLAAPLVAVPDDRETLRQQLVASALRLQGILDPTWQKYLALPSEVFTGQPLQPGTTFDPVMQRFRVVSNDPRYWTLNEHPEFQETQNLLRRYASLSQPRTAGTLSLPLPPGN